MVWIESHIDLGGHPKVFELMTALNADLSTTIGVLHLLWHFTMKFAWKTGDLAKFTNAAIVNALGLKNNPDEVIKALQDTQWLDDKKVHNWLDYAGKIVRDRVYNQERKRRKTAYSCVKAPLPDLTLPNLTIPNNKDIAQAPRIIKKEFIKPRPEEATAYAKEIGFILNGNEFCDYYEARGWEYKGGVAMKDWKAAVRTWKKGGYNAGQNFSRNTGGDNTAGTVDTAKYTDAGFPD